MLQASKATMLQQEARLLWEQDAVSGFKRKPERKIKYHRGVAQLVARLLWEQDAGGSSPSTPTKNTRRSSERFVFFCRFGAVFRQIKNVLPLFDSRRIEKGTNLWYYMDRNNEVISYERLRFWKQNP